MTYWSYQRCWSCSGKALPGTVALMQYTLERFPYCSSMGIYNCRDVRGGTSLSIHACGRALDVGIPVLSSGRANTALGHPVVQFFDQFSTEFGIMGQIYDRVRYDRGDPRGAYYGGTHPHYNHDHVEQRSEKALSLTRAEIIRIAGPAVPEGGDDMALKKNDSGRAVAEAQHAMTVLWGFDMQPEGEDWPGFDGLSVYTGRRFGPGEDGDFGNHMEAMVFRFQRNMDLPQTGVLDSFTAALLMEGLYRIGTGGVTQAIVEGMIATHAKQPASATLHPHSHDEGSTGPAR